MQPRLSFFSLPRHTPGQDRVLAVDLGSGRGLIGVADGVGGQPRGDVASKAAITTAEAVQKTRFTAPMPLVFAAAEDEVARQSEVYGEIATTLTLARIEGPRFTIGHTGDTRACRLRGGELTVLTRDHNLGRLLVEQGLAGEDDVHLVPGHNALTSCIGGGPMEVDVVSGEAEPGERLLITSDGVHELVPRARIAELSAAAGNVAELIEGLKAEVLRIGAVDDATAVAWEFG